MVSNIDKVIISRSGSCIGTSLHLAAITRPGWLDADTTKSDAGIASLRIHRMLAGVLFALGSALGALFVDCSGSRLATWLLQLHLTLLARQAGFLVNQYLFSLLIRGFG